MIHRSYYRYRQKNLMSNLYPEEHFAFVCSIYRRAQIGRINIPITNFIMAGKERGLVLAATCISLLLTVSGFSPCTPSFGFKYAQTIASRRFVIIRPAAKSNDHPMAKTSQLSHVMLRVPSVDETARYWTDKGGVIRIAKTKAETTVTSQPRHSMISAFVQLGNSLSSNDFNADDEKCFALELITTEKESYRLGNIISYVGVSMLLQFQKNLLGAIRGDEKPKARGNEPNGIPIRNAASAPGDLFARFALKTKDLTSTQNFYTTVIGMATKAVDSDVVCLRFETDSTGVPTTLVFDQTQDDLIMGDCFDHIAVTTTADIAEQYERICSMPNKPIVYMRPTEMFGKKVMGVMDPNGYKIVIASA